MSITVGKDNGFDCMCLDNDFINFFSHADPICMDEDPKCLSDAFLGSLNIRHNEWLLFADSLNHYIAVIFHEQDILILDSVKGPSVYSLQNGLTYLWQLSYSLGFAAYRISKHRSICIKDDKDSSDSFSHKQYTVFEISGKHSVFDGSQEVSCMFKHIKSHDIRSLDGNNDAVIASVCLAINRNFSNVSAADPLVASRLVHSPSSVMPSRISSSPQMNREGLLFPINYQSHWWVLSVNLASSSYSVLDSLGLRHDYEVLTLLKVLLSNGCRDASKYEKKSLCCFPQQKIINN